MRRLITFPCVDDMLVGTIDEGVGTTGLLIVSGGNEVRAGTHRGMTALAAHLSARGIPVFRYDRRGVGDSSGENLGFTHARDDLVAAAQAFRQEAPHLVSLVGFGNCDAATSLALFGREAGLDRILLANPWVVDTGDVSPPWSAARARYVARVRTPSTWIRGFSVSKLSRVLYGSFKRRGETDRPLADALSAIADWGLDAHVILAEQDMTALAYRAAARRAGLSPSTLSVATASHSFARPDDQDALFSAIAQFTGLG